MGPSAVKKDGSLPSIYPSVVASFTEIAPSSFFLYPVDTGVPSVGGEAQPAGSAREFLLQKKALVSDTTGHLFAFFPEFAWWNPPPPSNPAGLFSRSATKKVWTPIVASSAEERASSPLFPSVI